MSNLKVWTRAGLLIQQAGGFDDKHVPAGTCLFVSEDQSSVPPTALAVYGGGVYGIVSMEWLSYEPTLYYSVIQNAGQ